MGAMGVRGCRLSSRPFYTTVLFMCLLAAYSYLATTHQGLIPSTNRHGSFPLRRRGEERECREVHSASDQCEFVKQYCNDEDAGLLPYLQLYYCGLASAKPVAFVVLVVWLGLLFTTIGIAASDFFSVNLGTIATVLGLSESLAGVTFLAFGNGSPDVFSTFAAMSSNSASMAVGELIGAASFITGVVAGSMALVREFRVDTKTYARDICFFIVAVAFTMVFLADGELRFWECCVMVGYYVLYVITVVIWHWYSQRRRQKRRREGEARGHVYGLAGQSGDELAGEPYRDSLEDGGIREGGTNAHHQDLSALENGPRIQVDGQEIDTGAGEWDDEEGADGDLERLVAAEVASSMRVLRTGAKRPSLPKTPIRPSLVGALEFRSALAQLQRESNLLLGTIRERDSSGDRLRRRARRGTTGGTLDPRRSPHSPAFDSREYSLRRDRALSAGHTPASLGLLPEVEEDEGSPEHSESPGLARDATGPRAPSPPATHTVGRNLAPPRTSTARGPPRTEADNLEQRPSLELQIPSRRSSQSDVSSPRSPFPHYRDSAALLTPVVQSEQTEFLPPGLSRRESSFASLHMPAQRPLRWWPYNLLPPPHALFATLFPTLQGWKEKTHWDRFVSAISVPSIFLLVITLPVVEPDTSGSSDAETAVNSGGCGEDAEPAVPLAPADPDSPRASGEWERYRRHTLQQHRGRGTSRSPSPISNALPLQGTAVAALPAVTPRPAAVGPKPLSDSYSASHANDETAPWNRWLVCVQLFTGPLFAVVILWANLLEEWDRPRRQLLKMVLYALLGSLVLLVVLILFTSERSRPKYHFLLCFLGFVISIAWISTIAEEVVGVLQTFGVILGISEALLGLTIFAAGNSVGDLVADITVARLGYPVMAL